MSLLFEPSGFHLLLIEDNTEDAKILCHHLEKSKIIKKNNISHVKCLEQGLSLLKSQSFDVIISDLGLPDGVGPEIVRELQSICPKTPIIVATGDSREQTIVTCFSLGAEDYLEKAGISSSSLKRCVRNAVERKKLRNKLAEATIEANVASSAKSDFLAKMSHEIRTPLHLLMGTSELLKNTELNIQQEKYLMTFEKAGNHLLSIINNVLDMSKIESGNLQFHEAKFFLENELAKVAELASINCHSKKINFEFYMDPQLPQYMTGDAARIKQILLNLLNNSLKYTDDGSIRLIVEKSNNQIVFTVSDSGVGIPEDSAKQIFKSFYQVIRPEAKSGTGLGLSIAKELAVKMGGDLVYIPQLNKGSTFQFWLPLKETEIIYSTSNSFQLSGQSFFLLVSGTFNGQMLKDFITFYGGSVVTCHSGQQALDFFNRSKKRFNAYFFDLYMKDIGGLEGVKSIRHQIDLSKVIFLLPMIHRKKDLEEIEKLNKARYIYKPVGTGKVLGLFSDVEEVYPSKEDVVSSKGKSKILIVDDDVDNRNLLEAFLNVDGHELTLVKNGKEALESIKKKEFDIVLMDIQMPVMDGLQATKLIRRLEKENGSTRSLVVYGLSAYAYKEDIELAKAAGFTGYLTKPLKKQDLLRVVKGEGPDSTNFSSDN